MFTQTAAALRVDAGADPYARVPVTTTYDVCLVVTSDAVTLPELSVAIGIEPTEGSHSKGLSAGVFGH